jgi:hypothetical protein
VIDRRGLVPGSRQIRALPAVSVKATVKIAAGRAKGDVLGDDVTVSIYAASVDSIATLRILQILDLVIARIQHLYESFLGVCNYRFVLNGGLPR